ncbi:hypothetical protein [Clostridium sp. E02]|uniref:hypothetical protein n=1 Tax=Clostridium sp. E02 TaxID=2487134 RepID=UPI000F5244C1|nr:hypothetical protein [Clostridium sp. E02]
MQKTKLGVSVGLLGAALYFLGAISILPAFLLAGYVLFVEENEWLKKTAVKMVTIIVVFNVLKVAVEMLQDVFSSLDIIARWFINTNIVVPLNLDGLISIALSFILNLLLVVMGFSALSMGTLKIKFLDNIINKHM